MGIHKVTSISLQFLFGLIAASSVASAANTDRDAWGSSSKFPDQFIFGVSTAAYQVEGGWDADDKGLSVWDDVSHNANHWIADGSNGDVACDSYHQYKRDVEMLKELGVQSYRFSVAWTRILPSGLTNYISQAGINYYNNLIDELIENGIEPTITMYHFDLPLDLQVLGGWTNPQIVDWFAGYARVLYENFGDRVKKWVTFNEPNLLCLYGYGDQVMPPFANMSGVADFMCVKNVLLAHAASYHLYRDEFKTSQNGEMGMTVQVFWFYPASEDEEDMQIANDVLQFHYGIITNPIYSPEGDYPEVVKRRVAEISSQLGFQQSTLLELTPDEVERIRGSYDFYGVNYYSSRIVSSRATTRQLTSEGCTMAKMTEYTNAVWMTDSDWVAGSGYCGMFSVPDGLRQTLNYAKREYGNPPTYIFENGYTSDEGGLDDEQRVYYLREHLKQLQLALEDGCNVIGYYIWSLMDTFEWIGGYVPKMGLYEVDFESPERTRVPRSSAFFYQKLIKSRSIDEE